MASMSTCIIPTKEVKAEDNYCTIYENSMNYSTNFGEITVRKGNNNSIEVIENNTQNKLTVSNKGDVTLIIDKGNMCQRETFKINRFNAGRLDVDKSNISSSNIKKCLELLEYYFNSNTFTGPNYINYYNTGEFYDKTYGIDYSYIEETTKMQYNDVNLRFMIDASNANLLQSSMALTLMLGVLSSSSSEAINAIGSIACPEVVLVVATVGAIVALGYAYGNSMSIPIDRINDSDEDENVQEITKEKAISENFIAFSDAVDTIDNNYKDDNPNNDYYKAYRVSNATTDESVYINIVSPFSKENAGKVLINTADIYTKVPEDAKEVIRSVGGVPGTSNGKYPNKAECHAFKASYNAFDEITNLYDINKLIYSPTLKPGTQFWHFHFLNKQFFDTNTNRLLKIDKHIFFGLPIHISLNDSQVHRSDTHDKYLINEAKDTLFNEIDNAKNNIKKFIKKIRRYYEKIRFNSIH